MFGTLSAQSARHPWVAAILIGVVTGCATNPDQSPSDTREFIVTGVIAAPPGDGLVSVAHDDIAGLMPAMTMAFALADPGRERQLAPGDRVRFTLTVDETTTRARRFEVLSSDPLAGERFRRASSVAAGRVRAGDRLPAFSLVDQNNVALTEASLKGHRTVLTFVFTRCPLPEYCPRIVGAFRQLQRAVVADPRLEDVRLLSVTLDPEFDTPAVLEKYGQSMGADFARWRFATGAAEDVTELARAFAVRVEPSAAILNHTLATAAVDPEGRIIEIWRGNQWSVEDLLERLRNGDRAPE
jgi:protein SCO1/2